MIVGAVGGKREMGKIFDATGATRTKPHLLNNLSFKVLSEHLKTLSSHLKSVYVFPTNDVKILNFF